MTEQQNELPLSLLERVRQEGPAAAKRLLSSLPELRSVSIVFEWESSLNDGAPVGVWANRQGVVGGENNPAPRDSQAMRQTLRLLELQMALLAGSLRTLESALAGKQQLLEQVTEVLDAKKQDFEKAADGRKLRGAGGGSEDAAGSAETAPDRQ